MIAEMIKQLDDLTKEIRAYEKSSGGIFRNLPIEYFKKRGEIANLHYQLGCQYEKITQYNDAVSHYFKAWTLTQHSLAGSKLRIPLSRQPLSQPNTEAKSDAEPSSQPQNALNAGLRYLSGIGSEIYHTKALEAFTAAYQSSQRAEALLLMDLLQLHCFVTTDKLKDTKLKIIINEAKDSCAARDFLKYIISENDLFWLISSADNNYPPAQYIYGLLLEDTEESESAKTWIQKSAAQGYEPAIKKLNGETITPLNSLFYFNFAATEMESASNTPKPASPY